MAMMLQGNVSDKRHVLRKDHEAPSAIRLFMLSISTRKCVTDEQLLAGQSLKSPFILSSGSNCRCAKCASQELTVS